jgi:hypothetical protein
MTEPFRDDRPTEPPEFNNPDDDRDEDTEIDPEVDPEMFDENDDESAFGSRA